MTVLHIIPLLALRELLRFDILVWLAAIPLLIAAVIMLFFQQYQYRSLNAELKQLLKNKRHTIEYDLVLKAMKLCIWRIDIPTRTITYESDYRDSSTSQIIPSGSVADVFCDTLLPEYRAKVHDGIMDLVEGRSDEFHEQYEMQVPQSTRTTWGESYATIEKRDLEGRPVLIVGTSMRIDRQKEIEQKLIEALKHAEESDRLKSAFLANMSHEIRTPLNAIVGFSDILPMVKDEEERQHLVSLIKQNNAHLLHLFDDMVNMSKLEAGSETVKKRRFELNALLMEVVDKYADKSRQTGVKIQVEAMTDDPMPNTDRNRLREILNQYVDNAMKFTSKGCVTLGYSIHKGLLRIWVKDTGKGIPEEHCGDHIFERFVKVDDFVPGTGLGLSICRSLALSLGGTVGVESKLGEGSLFWVELDVS